jgi:hypothetical protein
VPSRRVTALIVFAIAAVLVATGIGWIPVRVAPTPPSPSTGPAHATVTIVGRPDSFGALGGSTASGQSLALRPVPGWSIPAGYALGTPTLASDGTLLMPLVTQALDLYQPTGRALGVATYRPADNTFATTTIDESRTGLAPSVADLAPVGDAVAFSVAAAPAAPDVPWPVFGILSKVDGGWRVASGNGWRNAWTAADLGLDGGALSMMVRLPGSGDLAIMRTFLDGRPGAELVTVRVAGPDAGGRFSASVVARSRYDTGTVVVLPEHMAADPTRRRGDELFGVTFGPRGALVEGGSEPPVLQEFGYDADQGTLRLASAPLIPGGAEDDGDLYGFAAIHYDRHGVLWAARNLVFHAWDIAVYTRPRCAPVDGRAVTNYRSPAPQRNSWGMTCPPAYDILQGRGLNPVNTIVEDGATGDLALLTLGGQLMTMRPGVDGAKLALQIGNVMDIDSTLLPRLDGGDPIWSDEYAGAVDDAHRAWMVVRQKLGTGMKPVPDAPVLDQWLVAVELPDAFAPDPVEISDVPGQDTVVQAERTLNFGTHQFEQSGRPVIVDSETFVQGCAAAFPVNVSCGYDGVPGAGFKLSASHFLGHTVDPMDYRVHVPTAGNYRVGLRAYTFKAVQLDLVAGDRSYRVSFDKSGDFAVIWLNQLVRLEAGEQTIRLASAPGNAGGWVLNSFVLRRA